MKSSPILSKNVFAFEVKAWLKGMPKVFENIEPELVILEKDDSYLACEEYMKYLADCGTDTSNVREIRVNKLGYAQGHYFQPNGWD